MFAKKTFNVQRVRTTGGFTLGRETEITVAQTYLVSKVMTLLMLNAVPSCIYTVLTRLLFNRYKGYI